MRALEPKVILSKISDGSLFCLRMTRSIHRRRPYQGAQPTPIDSPTSCECRRVDSIEVRALEPKVILGKISDGSLFCLRMIRSIQRRRRFQCAQPTPIDSPTSYECRGVDWIEVRALEPKVILSKISDGSLFCLRKTKVDTSTQTLPGRATDSNRLPYIVRVQGSRLDRGARPGTKSHP